MQDRFLSLESAKLVFKGIGHLQEKISYAKDGIIQRHAQATLLSCRSTTDAQSSPSRHHLNVLNDQPLPHM